MALCIQCNRRPRPKDNSRMTCKPCQSDIDDTEQAEKKRREASLTNLANYWKLLHWRGHVVGLTLNDQDKVHPTVTGRYVKFVDTVKGLPKGKLVNLDLWCPEYNKGQIKIMKQMIQKLAPGAPVRVRKVEK